MSKAVDEITVRAPARVNLIGEHTDYNGGYVLPAAISLEITARGRLRNDEKVSVRAEDIGHSAEFDLNDIRFDREHPWLNYIQGVAFFLIKAGFSLKGVDMSVRGNIPRGAGLSSSAALEVASALVFQGLSGFEFTPVETAKLCQKAENEFVGMRCGIMDQFACCLGRENSAVFLDCRTLDFSHVPLDDDIRIVICNTGVRRELASSEYNMRRAECEKAAGLLGVPDLSRVSAGELEEKAGSLPEVLLKRAGHVVSENGRVLKAVEALKGGRFGELKELFSSSHASLRDDFEVSCPELDLMVRLASEVRGVFGARMTGAGFGGCAVSLVRAESVDEFLEAVPGKYRLQTGIEPEIYVCRAVGGAGIID